MSAMNLLNEGAKQSSLPTADLLGLLLREQHDLSAVERFAERHVAAETPLQARYYRDLIPLNLPKPGEQFAFEVDLDACSGCKSCVVACHTLNGLEEHEMWRSVGLLHGGSNQLPVLQHVTTACHHCVEPACLEGCPVEAYEKDPVTGIVRHLDDQCIGCQYCILKCPYDVPKYSHSKGIVRKCDMCRNRLAVGEAPACVQACPHQAIRITVVNKQETLENAEANLFLPGAPEPGYTLPSTVYKTRKPLPANLLPADYYSATPQHAHLPLVFMLVLTQMSVGAFLVEQIIGMIAFTLEQDVPPFARMVHSGGAFLLGMLGLLASVFHLGRPWLAYRAVIAWRTSWLSREALAFGAFAFLASVYSVLPWLESFGLVVSNGTERSLGMSVVASGLAGVFCSAMIYASTRRAFWNVGYSSFKFLLTCVILGIPVALLLQLVAVAWSPTENVGQVMNTPGGALCACLMGISLLKLLAEAAIFGWLHAPTFTPLRRTALLMSGDLRQITKRRFLLGLLGGVVLPGVLLASIWLSHHPLHPIVAITGVIFIMLICLTGELLERYLFFAAVVAPKMPGVPAT